MYHEWVTIREAQLTSDDVVRGSLAEREGENGKFIHGFPFTSRSPKPKIISQLQYGDMTT